MAPSVLVLDVQPPTLGDVVSVLRELVGPESEIRSVESVAACFDAARSEAHQLVLVHGDFGGRPGGALQVVPQIREKLRDAAVVVVADEGNVELVALAVHAGATDFLVRGPRLGDRVLTMLGKLEGLFAALDRNRLLDADNTELRRAIQARFQLVGESPQVQTLLDRVQRVAAVPRPVLVLGERGTGKELVARAIHFAGGAPSRPIVTVNCAAFTDALLESELFGHERGAFTGADAQRRGKFEQADGGTLFLDEVANMSLAFQQKILRVVEYGSFSRVGGTAEISTTARIIAATNADLRAMMERGEFQRDLYDRLSFEVIEVPPLRERKGDIAVLARHFLARFALEIPAFTGKVLAPSVLRALEDYGFPGNVRELKNIIERAAYRDTTNEITLEDVGLLPDAPADSGGTFVDQMNALACRLLTRALAEAGGNQAAAARALGLTYDQFRHHRRKHLS